jgi:hypothetical protein
LGIGNEIWKVEGKTRGWVWVIDIIKVDIGRIGWRNLDLFRTATGGGGCLKCFEEFSGALKCRKFLD